MTGLLWLHDARLRPLALSPAPAWLWATDRSCVLWANPTGAAMLGAPTAAALSVRHFEPSEAAIAEVARLAATLRPDGTARLERLRGFGAELGRPLTCRCARLTFADGTGGILIAALEPVGPPLSLSQRAVRLIAAVIEPLAVFDSKGGLVEATPAARRLIGDRRELRSVASEAALAAASARSDVEESRSLVRLREGWIVLLDTNDVAPAPSLAGAPASSAPTEPPASGVVAEAPGAPSLVGAPPEPAEPPPSAAAISTMEGAPRQARAHPLRFVWQMDADGRFNLDSPEFVGLMEPHTAALLGRSWTLFAAETGLDPDAAVARALATRDTFSGLCVRWPVADDRRLAVELSGLPVFDRDRNFRGYRGFGVCRELRRLDAITQAEPATEAPAGELAGLPVDVRTPGLSPVEQHAFVELSRQLTRRINEADSQARRAANANDVATDHALPELAPDEPETTPLDPLRPFLDRLPIGVLIYRLTDLVYANPAFLAWVGFPDLDALAEAGGLDALTIEADASDVEQERNFAIASPSDPTARAEARLLHVPWNGEPAFALTTMPGLEPAARRDVAEDLKSQVEELAAILDTATDGVVVLDRAAQIVSSNRSAQALFGYDAQELQGCLFSDLFTPESVGTAIDYFERLQAKGIAALINDGREIVGRERLGGLIPLFMTMGRLREGGDRFCAVFRDLTQWKKAEDELVAARREAERASSAKSDFLARISHEIRTPLNAIIGFSEVMSQERFGPLGNDRYRQYLKDIHASGEHVISLINDLLDLSKIEAGKLDLTFADIALNDLTQQCVALMQPQANRERVIIRTALTPRLPAVAADARSVRQMVLNLLSNSIKFTAAGGQVIVSTAATDREVVLRVRDTGIGMSEADLAVALEPFRQVATATRARPGGTGLGLPLTRALAEANHARFHIRSRPNEGTLVEIGFPAARMLAAQ